MLVNTSPESIISAIPVPVNVPYGVYSKETTFTDSLGIPRIKCCIDYIVWSLSRVICQLVTDADVTNKMAKHQYTVKALDTPSELWSAYLVACNKVKNYYYTFI